jgi:rhodanese-related sulfurtransferase
LTPAGCSRYHEEQDSNTLALPKYSGGFFIMETISPQQLKARLDQNESLLIIDVREPEETAAGIIPGAILIPLMQISERLKEIPQDQETILVCRSGNRSGRAYDYLQSQGFANIKSMSGGMLEWDAL